MTRNLFIPVSTKVYGICIAMLLFLMAVAIANYVRMTLVKEEVSDIAMFTSPISKYVAKINIAVLEQEISFERIVRLARQGENWQQELRNEQQRFETLNQTVTEYLIKTQELANTATEVSQIRADIVAFARISPELVILSQDHQQFARLAQEILEARANNETQKQQFLDQQLEQNETIFNQRIHRLQNWLAEFSNNSIQEIKHQDQQLLQFNYAISVIAVLTGIFCAAWASKKLVNPLKELIESSKAIENGKYELDIALPQKDEIGELANSLSTLLNQVAQKERIRTSFHEYLDPRVIELLSKDGNYSKGKAQNVTVLFSDIAHFSKLSETLSPEALVAVINEYYNLAGQSLIKTEGVVDKFIGDAIVAFWGQPFVPEEEHARLACLGAIRQLEQLEHLRLALPDLVGIRKGLPNIDIRIGLASGNLVLGNIGTEKTSTFTIIGAAVHMAEALEQLNKKLGSRILVTEETKELAGDEFQFRLVAEEPLLPDIPVLIYELLGFKADFDEPDFRRIRRFENAIYAFLNDDLPGAKMQFEHYLNDYENDDAARYHWHKLNQR